MSSISRLLDEAELAVGGAVSLYELDAVRVKYLGRKGLLTTYLKQLGEAPTADRPQIGKEVNEAKRRVVKAIEVRQRLLEEEVINAALIEDRLDVTLPGRGEGLGHLHPLSRTLRRATKIFERSGFRVRTGPEVEDEHYNFTALNMPENHPARDMHDTFYLKSPGKLLRTHTSPVQIHAMEKHGVPIKVIAPGRVYRCDSDLTHTPMFTQIEGLAVDRGISFANLKSVLYEFVSEFFGREVELRFRPSYFPFTEPSAEVDIFSETGKWLEILGCGMVHPNVFLQVGVDPEEYSGYAFGMGIERLAMLQYKVDDLRLFFENDLRFLKQFA